MTKKADNQKSHETNPKTNHGSNHEAMPETDYRTNQKTSHQPSSSLKFRSIIVTLALLLVALFLPLLGESLQMLTIGEEYVCCMPDNRAELEAKAEIAKSLRPASNLIIGGSMLAGIILSIIAITYFYRKNKNYVKDHPLIMVILLVITVYIIIVLTTMLMFFALYNDAYFEQRPWPGGSLYDGAWYSPSHWWAATFINPFSEL